ncbi:hypothetical protein [Candidatus Viridilinea mediisalina]|nr:hypothetical protein [Candidatus Viridilinea mediisalina]
MQIHISWKTIFATFIFIISIMLLLRVSFILRDPPMLAEADPLPSPSLTADGLYDTETVTSTAPSGMTATPTLERLEVTVTPTAEQSTPSPTATPTIEGPVALTSTPTPALPQVLTSGFGQVAGTVNYAFIVSNTNPDQLFQEVRYRIAAYDSTGIVLSTHDGTIAQIGANQEIGIVGSITLNAELTVSRIDVDVFRARAIGVTDGVAPLLEGLTVVEPALVPGDQPSLTGIVRNALDRDFEGVTIYGIAYNEREEIIGGGRGSVSFIAAHGQAPVSMPVVMSGEVAKVAFWPVLSTGE